MPRTALPRTRQFPAAKRHRSRVAFAPPAAPPSVAAATAFLTDVLVGENRWRMAEVQSLIALHTLVAVGRWHANGLDDSAFAIE